MQYCKEKLKVYLDTSVISYLEQDDAPHEMQTTRELWEHIRAGVYDVYISDVVVNEIGNCTDKNKRMLLLSHLDEIQYREVKIDKPTKKLAQHFIDSGILKAKNSEDCQHIAATILNNCDIIVSWNFKHIVNVKTMQGVKVVATKKASSEYTRRLEQIIRSCRVTPREWLYYNNWLDFRDGAREEGAHDAMQKAARNLLQMGLTAEQVAQGTGLPEQEIASLCAQIALR